MKIHRAIAIGVLCLGAGIHSAGAQPDFHGIAAEPESDDVSAFRAAIEREDPDAMYTLGLMLDEGSGVASDAQMSCVLPDAPEKCEP